MARRKNGDEIQDGTDHRIGNNPTDQDPQWQEIYAALKAAIGEWAAFNWFGGCRFVSVDREIIRLRHWGEFQANECLKRYGPELCRAAGVKGAQIACGGGYRPAGIKTPAAAEGRGTAHYSLPRASSAAVEVML